MNRHRAAAPGRDDARDEVVNRERAPGAATTQAVETELAVDMLKHAVPFAPAIVLVSWLIWGSRRRVVGPARGRRRHR